VCTGKPKTPKVQEIPDRRASVLPDGGDPNVRLATRQRQRLMASSMIFTNQGTLGAPSLATPSSPGY